MLFVCRSSLGRSQNYPEITQMYVDNSKTEPRGLCEGRGFFGERTLAGEAGLCGFFGAASITLLIIISHAE